MNSPEIQHLIKLLARLPGLGPRSGRRAALTLMKEKEKFLKPLWEALGSVAEKVQTCKACGNLDTLEECSICLDPRRDGETLCIVEEVGDLWALERSGSYKGHYHIMGGALSALDGRGPDDLNFEKLLKRVSAKVYKEVILALSATMEGQTTSHYIIDCLAHLNLKVTIIAHGVPVGGELDYLDDGTLMAALNARHAI